MQPINNDEKSIFQNICEGASTGAKYGILVGTGFNTTIRMVGANHAVAEMVNKAIGYELQWPIWNNECDPLTDTAIKSNVNACFIVCSTTLFGASVGAVAGLVKGIFA